MADRSRNWRGRDAGARRREDLLEAVEKFSEEHGYSPTIAELAQMLNVSEATVKRHVQVLVNEGRLERGPGPRTLRIPF